MAPGAGPPVSAAPPPGRRSFSRAPAVRRHPLSVRWSGPPWDSPFSLRLFGREALPVGFDPAASDRPPALLGLCFSSRTLRSLFRKASGPSAPPRYSSPAIHGRCPARFVPIPASALPLPSFLRQETAVLSLLSRHPSAPVIHARCPMCSAPIPPGLQSCSRQRAPAPLCGFSVPAGGPSARHPSPARRHPLPVPDPRPPGDPAGSALSRRCSAQTASRRPPSCHLSAPPARPKLLRSGSDLPFPSAFRTWPASVQPPPAPRSPPASSPPCPGNHPWHLEWRDPRNRCPGICSYPYWSRRSVPGPPNCRRSHRRCGSP